jgi:pSer/pThr/pTyr-binding forkhead associated (FHA) protein
VQHNAAINPGNSGGPLFDACTTVIGVNSFFPRGAQGVFFSIHVAEITRLLHDLKIPYRKASGPCHLASLSGGGGPLLPLLIAASALLAVVALAFALDKSRLVGVLRRCADSLVSLGKTKPLAAALAPVGWAAVCDVVSLRPVAGDSGHTLEGGRALTVGRAKGCDVILNDDTVSNTHARVEFNPKDQWVTVSDLDSSNGTFLNGSRIGSAQARIGDVLRLAAGAAPSPTPLPGWMLSGFDPAGRAVQFELRPTSNSGAGTSWTLGRDGTRAQLVIDDNSVSGAHAQFTYLPAQGLSLRDLGSTNGTRVDGKALGASAVVLSDSGQEIIFGAAKLRLSRLLA